MAEITEARQAIPYHRNQSKAISQNPSSPSQLAKRKRILMEKDWVSLYLVLSHVVNRKYFEFHHGIYGTVELHDAVEI